MMVIGDDDDEKNEDVVSGPQIMKIKRIKLNRFRVSNLKWTTWETS